MAESSDRGTPVPSSGTPLRGARRDRVHRAVLCASTEAMTGQAVDRLWAAVHAGRTVVAALRPAVEASVRAALGADTAARVVFVPGTENSGHASGHPVCTYLDRVPARALGSPLSVVADVHAAGPDPYAARCLEAEVLVNRALAAQEREEEHTCLYPAHSPFARVARWTHPVLALTGMGGVDGEVSGTEDMVNVRYRDPDELIAARPELAHLDPDALVRDVTPHTDPALRRWIAERAREAGIDGIVREETVLAVHEALRAGAESGPGPRAGADGAADALPTTRLYLRQGPAGGFVCDVDAAWLPPLPTGALPTEDAVTGLWWANVGCRDVSISVHPLDTDRSRIRVSTGRPP